MKDNIKPVGVISFLPELCVWVALDTLHVSLC